MSSRKRPLLKTNKLTRDHRPMLENLQFDPAALRAIDDQRIGRLLPTKSGADHERHQRRHGALRAGSSADTEIRAARSQREHGHRR